jgi:hypothetical protein
MLKPAINQEKFIVSKFDKDKPAMLCNKFEKWLHILKFGDYYRTEADLPGGLRK